jgi:presenilin-like A22 family membrane protease
VTEPTKPLETPKPSETPKASADAEEFRARPLYLVPILASLLAGLGFAFILVLRPVETLPVTPFPDTPSGSFSNALYFVVVIALAATIFYLLIKYRTKKLITLLVGFAMTAAAVLLSAFYLFALLSSFPNWEIYVIVLTIVFTVVSDYAVFKLGGTAQNVVVLIIGGALGVFLGWSIPLWSAVLILAFLAVYDIIAVYKGPVGKIAASSGLDQLKGLSFSFKEIQMGLGDLVFYSMLCAAMLRSFTWLSYAVAFVGVVAGSFVTLWILEKKGMFPGLPVPILLGLTGGLLASLIPV